MLKPGSVLNPAIRSLLARVRHTNTLVIADRGFPSWPQVETVDISLVDGVPTVLQVLAAVKPEWTFGKAFMAEEFRSVNAQKTVSLFERALGPVSIRYEAHVALKQRVPACIGLIRTGDTIQYGNVILESA